jgi:hypothetical protein
LGEPWRLGEEGDECWYDFGPVNLADESQHGPLCARIVEVLETIQLSKQQP